MLGLGGRKEMQCGMLCSSVQSGREIEQRERGRENAAGRAGALLKRRIVRGGGSGQRQRVMGTVGEQGMGNHGVGTARAEQSSGSTMWPYGIHISGDSKKIRSKPQ